MCDRTKTEILARELAIEFYNGAHYALNPDKPKKSLKEFVERNWKDFESKSILIIESLNKHKK